MRRIASAGAVLAGLATPTAAQVSRAGDVWRWIAFTTASGLPGTRIGFLAGTADGLAWVSTDKGLAWFDGYRWRTVRILESPAPAHVMALAGDRRGRLLVVADSAVYRADTSGVRVLPLREAGRRLVVTRAAASNGDTVLVVSRARLHVCAGQDCWPLSPPPGPAWGNVHGLWATRAGVVWINTDAGLVSLDGGEWRLRFPWSGVSQDVQVLVEGAMGAGVAVVSPPSPAAGLLEWDQGTPLRRNAAVPNAVAASGDVGPGGRAAVAYSSLDLSVRERGAWRWMPVPASIGAIRALHYAATGDLWVGGEGGLFLYRESSRLWSYHQGEPGDPRNRVNVVLRTRDGSLWLGTDPGVLVQHADGRISRIDAIGGSPLPAITGLAEDERGGVWISSGTVRIGAYRWQGGAWRQFGDRDGLGTARIHRIVRDRRGGLIFLGLGETFGGSGVYRLERGRFARVVPAEDLPSGRVYGVAEGPDGAWWFGTAGGLRRYLHGEWRQWGAPDALRSSRVFAVAVDDGGRVWFAHQFDFGIGLLEPDGLIRYLTIANGLPSDEVWDLQVAPDGSVWAATAGGLARCHSDGCVAFRMDDGLSSLALWPVLPTADRVYVGTLGSGLAVLNLEEARNHNVRVEILSDAADGANRTGVRWVADGYLGWPEAGRIHTRYRVNGGSWSPWSTDRSVALAGLRFGRHRVAVEARDWLGNSSDTVETRFTIPPPLLLRPAVSVPLATLLLTSLGLAGALALRRRRYEEERRAGEARNRRLASAVEQASDGIAISDPSGIVEFVNPAFEAITGWSAADVEGRLVRQLPVDPGDTDHYRAVTDALERGEVWEGEGVARRKDGGTFRAFQRVTPLRDPSGRIANYVWLLRDITREIQLQEELREVQKLQAVGQLSGGIAHDFNNLLAVILANASMLAEDLAGANDETRRSVEDIAASARRGAELVSSLLAFGRRRRLVFRALDPVALVAEFVASLRGLLPPAIRVEHRVEGTVPPVLADAAAVQQVLSSLASNARDAMPDGGTLSLGLALAGAGGPDEAATSPVRARPHVCLTVSDSGVGMDARTLERALDPFFTTKPPGAGTGLGLSVVSGLVDQHGGELEIDSVPGAGTTVRVRLPVARPAQDAPPADLPAARTARGEAETVLVAEDDAHLRRAAELALTRLGFRVVAAADGEEALRMFHAQRGEIALVLSDVVMPRLDGPGLYAALSREGCRPPFVFTSGYPDLEFGRSRVLDPAVPFLMKPWTAEALARVVREALGRGAVA